MAFHKSKMGVLGNNLPCDLKGMVPEEDDRPEDFQWEASTTWTEESWKEFLQKAWTARQQAEARAARWRAEGMGGQHV